MANLSFLNTVKLDFHWMDQSCLLFLSILPIISINTNKEAERTRQQQIMMQMSGKQGSSDMFNPFH
ncbi:hypothetical protein OZV76_00575 [Streptococcus thermophilus]|nr:hypothetical protein [Streptococcus thermophilus]MBW7825215.1 hypothetical protein [Streptococcus thermophilus]MCZ0706845.1 hypothetical protein [Streptococcus thermophilus]MDA5405230.1 hypothetical protein [Streptococcus thermophilus]MDA5411375.1 hypothetical protein [Streptococcus thermophilus]MDA5453670.1 hypothetical protein [Streptococcus thermophilus]